MIGRSSCQEERIDGQLVARSNLPNLSTSRGYCPLRVFLVRFWQRLFNRKAWPFPGWV